MKHLLHKFLFLAVLFCLLPLSTHDRAAAQANGPRVFLLTGDDALTPAMVEYLQRGIRQAEQQNAELLIFQLNTPGGSTNLMNRMVQDIRASRVPVVVYVAPRGAMAGSAGAIITLAAHASAMAPETTIGAASPVGGQGEDLGETMLAKEVNIMKATVRSLTQGRPEAAIKLAEQMIESAQAVSASEAKEIGLVDLVAPDLDSLLEQLDGFTVQLPGGERVLNTKDAQIIEVSTSFIEELLSVLTNPNIVFLLITIGVQAILIELSSPGGWVAGFLGAVCLALAFYGLGVLDVNWFGVIFLLIAFVLFILDIKAPTHGALTVAGVASLIVGALVLFNSPSIPQFQPRVSIPLVIGMSLATGAIFFVILLFAVRARHVPVLTGPESIIGRSGRALTDIPPRGTGRVQLASEAWSAEAEDGEALISAGERVQVMRVTGVRLVVRKLGD